MSVCYGFQEISIIDVKVWFQHYNYTDRVDSDFWFVSILKSDSTLCLDYSCCFDKCGDYLIDCQSEYVTREQGYLAFSCFFSGIWSTALYHVW